MSELRLLLHIIGIVIELAVWGIAWWCMIGWVVPLIAVTP